MHAAPIGNGSCVVTAPGPSVSITSSTVVPSWVHVECSWNGPAEYAGDPGPVTDFVTRSDACGAAMATNTTEPLPR